MRLALSRTESRQLSNDPLLEDELIDVLGLYLNPPSKAVVLCMDAKSQIQARSPKGPGSRAAGIAMAFKLVEGRPAAVALGQRTHLVALVPAGAKFEKGVLIERTTTEDQEAAA